MQDTSIQSMEEKALEAGGCEHIQVPGFEIMGPRRLFLPFHHWEVHLGRLEGGWIVGHPRGLHAHQFHWRRFLGASVGLGGKASRIRLLEGSWSKEAPFICRVSVFIPRIHGAKMWAR